MRLFLAIDPGDGCRRHVAGIVQTVRASTSGIRWVRDEKLHITLSFLGEVDESRVDEISAAARDVAVRHSPFSVSVEGSGVFPDWRKLRVVWLGLRDSGALVQLGKDISAMCVGLGFPRDRPFRAHLTIGRLTGPLSAEQKVSLRQALKVPAAAYPFDVTRVVLMRSTLSGGGSTYSELGSFPLGGV